MSIFFPSSCSLGEALRSIGLAILKRENKTKQSDSAISGECSLVEILSSF